MSGSIPFRSATPRRLRRLAIVALVGALGALAASDAALADVPSPHKQKGQPTPPPPPQPQPQPKPNVVVDEGDAGAAHGDGGAAILAPPMSPEEQKAQLDDIRSKASRIARAKGQRQALRTKVEAIMKGREMDAGLKQELLLHAKRVARLERARAVASARKDTEQVTRATALLERESARHEGWVTAFAARVLP